MSHVVALTLVSRLKEFGDLTMAEYLASGSIVSAGEVLDYWKQFGEWFTPHTK